ncbi:MAG: hypothetical protein PHP23_13395 [Desulfobacterales bacterium]|nr:hypothetical protein [Desulfobacterales bacterium]MDD4072905.1 hypothetical protein [Desulfobacterales bacterium]MDD4393737.1 hypothetical protein [Desulfobacterales bacterium]
MSQEHTIKTFVKEKKTLLIIIAVVLFLLELEIFAVAVVKSGRKAWLQVTDQHGDIVHEAEGYSLSNFDRENFEKAFGSLKNYQVRLITKEFPFPFRAWFVAAIGIPVGVILLFCFIVKAYLTVMYGEEKKKETKDLPEKEYESGFEKLVGKISSLNIFVIGALVLIAVVAYWVIPNVITYIGKIGIETFMRHKWVFLGIAVVLLAIVIWIVYLRYLLAKKTIETQAEVNKFRLELEMIKSGEMPARIEYKQGDESGEPQLVGWHETDEDQPDYKEGENNGKN